MTELLNGRPTPSTQCFNAGSSQGVFPLVSFSISSHALIYEAAGSGGASFKFLCENRRLATESDNKEAVYEIRLSGRDQWKLF